VRTVEELEERLSRPRSALIEDFGRLDGDIVVLGAGGKMGPSLVRLATRAVTEAGTGTKVTAVSRFSQPGSAEAMRVSGAEVHPADLSDDDAIASLPDAAGMQRIFAELQLAAWQEDRSMLEISSMVALGAVRTGVRLGNVHIFDYYRSALRTIVEEGLLTFLRRTSTPYLTRAGSHFDPRSSTHSERLLRRWADRRSPAGRRPTPQAEAPDEEKAARG
jgi:hypothetical protein